MILVISLYFLLCFHLVSSVDDHNGIGVVVRRHFGYFFKLRVVQGARSGYIFDVRYKTHLSSMSLWGLGTTPATVVAPHFEWNFDFSVGVSYFKTPETVRVVSTSSSSAHHTVSS